MSDVYRFDMKVTTSAGAGEVVRARIREGLSQLGGCEIEMKATPEADFTSAINTPITIEVLMEGVPIRKFTFTCHQASVLGIWRDRSLHRLVGYPKLRFLKLAKNTRKFRKMTAKDIVTKVLDEGGVDHKWQITREPEERNYCVQYRETNLDFVCRLLEFEGIYYAFDDAGTLILCDQSAAADTIDGQSALPLLDPDQALEHGGLGITNFFEGAKVGPGKATVNDFNWKTPSVNLLQSAPGKNDTDLEIYDYPSGYRDPAVGAELAQRRVEALEATKRYVVGTSNAATVMSNRKLTFLHAMFPGVTGMNMGGDYLMVEVEHNVIAGDPGAQTATEYNNRFKGIPADTPFRPPLITPRPTIAGNHTAMVRGPEGEEIHTDKFGRFRAQFHWDREAVGTDEDSRWVRNLQETASGMVLARVGWEVNMSYIDGDPDRPVGVSRDINGEMTPRYKQPALKNAMTISTESYPGKGGFNELRMDDSAGSMRIDLHAQRDFIGIVKHDRTETIGNDEWHLANKNFEHTVEKNQTLTIGGNDTRYTSAEMKFDVNQNRTKTIGGSENIDISDNFLLNISGNSTETVGSLRRTFAGSFGVTIPSPRELIDEIVPKGADFHAALGAGVSANLGANQGTSGAIGAAAGVLGGGGGARAAAQAAGSALSSGGGGGGGGGTGGALGAAAATAINGGGLGAAGQQLRGALPTPQGMLSKATGGLSDIRSFDDALAALTKGSITRLAEKSIYRMVGGAYVGMAAGNFINQAGKLFAETVGGLKLTLAAKGGISQSVSGYLLHTVGGMILRKSKNHMSVSSKISSVVVGANATFKSDEKIELRGDEIELEAATSFTIEAGDLKIELTPGKTTIKGDVKLNSDKEIKVAGGPDNLTA